jgi:hypothetical protein
VSDFFGGSATTATSYTFHPFEVTFTTAPCAHTQPRRPVFDRARGLGLRWCRDCRHYVRMRRVVVNWGGLEVASWVYEIVPTPEP